MGLTRTLYNKDLCVLCSHSLSNAPPLKRAFIPIVLSVVILDSDKLLTDVHFVSTPSFFQAGRQRTPDIEGKSPALEEGSLMQEMHSCYRVFRGPSGQSPTSRKGIVVTHTFTQLKRHTKLESPSQDLGLQDSILHTIAFDHIFPKCLSEHC